MQVLFSLHAPLTMRCACQHKAGLLEQLPREPCRCQFRLAQFADARLAALQARIDAPEHVRRRDDLAAQQKQLAEVRAEYERAERAKTITSKLRSRYLRAPVMVDRLVAEIQALEGPLEEYRKVRSHDCWTA
jgi:hypothetical protein